MKYKIRIQEAGKVDPNGDIISKKALKKMAKDCIGKPVLDEKGNIIGKVILSHMVDNSLNIVCEYRRRNEFH